MESTPLPRRSPWFILSGLCMLGGGALVNLGVHARKDEVAPIVGMVLTVAVYQALVAALAVWLARSGRSRRDAAVLALLLLLLVADATLLTGELITAAPWGGVFFAGAACAVGVVELVWMLGAIGVRLGRAGWALTAGHLLVAVALPAAYRALAGGTGFVPEAAVYAAAWVTAGVAVSATALWSLRRWHEPWRAGRLHAAVLAVPVVSVALHAWAGVFTYGIELSPALIAPVVLGLAALPMLMTPVAFGLPAGALLTLIALAMTGEVSGLPSETGTTPWRLMLLGTAALLGVIALARPAWWAALSAVLPVSAVFLGAGAEETGEKVGVAGKHTGQSLGKLCSALMPDTLVGWGAVAAALAFLLLGVGAWFARRRHDDNDEVFGVEVQALE